MSIMDHWQRLKIPSSGLLLWSCHSFIANQQVLYKHRFLHCTSSLLSTFSSYQVIFAFQCRCPPYILRFGRRSELANFTMLVSSKAVAASSINTWWEMTRLWNVRRTLPLLFSSKDRGGHLHFLSIQYNGISTTHSTVQLYEYVGFQTPYTHVPCLPNTSEAEVGDFKRWECWSRLRREHWQQR